MSSSNATPPLKQKVALGFKSLLGGAKKLANVGDAAATDNKTADISQLFPHTNPAVDGDDCAHDCESCHVQYPRGFKIDESDLLYGQVKGWATHVLVATSKTDWVRDVEDEKGSVMQAFGKADKPSNGRLMLSASNIPTPSHTADYSEPTTILLLPAFTVIENVTPVTVPSIVAEYVNNAPTTTSPLSPVTLPRSLSLPSGDEAAPGQLLASSSPHRALVLICSQKTRDARCGQSAPILRKELERHLRPLDLYRDLDDERPGGVGIYFISHVGGHKYSANMMVYRRPDAFGVDGVQRGKLGPEEEVVPKRPAGKAKKAEDEAVPSNVSSDGNSQVEAEKHKTKDEDEEGDVGAAQCIWLARVRPEDCENIVKYTVLQGKVVKADKQLRGGFDRGRGLLSW